MIRRRSRPPDAGNSNGTQAITPMARSNEKGRPTSRRHASRDVAKRLRCPKCAKRGCEVKTFPLITPRGRHTSYN